MNERDRNWRVGGASVRGASHVRKGVGNQDALDWWPHDRQSTTPILVVSDGHGGDANFRSDIGSRLAVETVLDVVGPFAEECRGLGREELFKRSARIGERIVAGWRKRVDQDVAANPLSPAAAADPDSRYLPYGATFIAAAILQDHLIAIQLGDGDILVSDSQGFVDRPLPEDKGLVGEQTYSLCLPNANDRIRHRLVPFSERDGPEFVMVSTDGLAKSFSDE